MKHGIPCADGTSRPPATPGEQAYAKALQQLGAVRPLIGRAVEEERLARESLMAALRTLGPINPTTDAALLRWRKARRVRKQAEFEVERFTAHLDAAIQEWAAECAEAWSAA